MSKLKKQLITVALSVLMVFALVGMAVVTMPVAKADDDKEQVIAAINTVVEAADTAEEGEEKDGKLTDEELEAILDTMTPEVAVALFIVGNSEALNFTDETTKDNFDKIRVFFREPNNIIAQSDKFTSNYINNKLTYDEYETLKGWYDEYDATEEIWTEEYYHIGDVELGEGWYVLNGDTYESVVDYGWYVLNAGAYVPVDGEGWYVLNAGAYESVGGEGWYVYDGENFDVVDAEGNYKYNEINQEWELAGEEDEDYVAAVKAVEAVEAVEAEYAPAHHVDTVYTYKFRAYVNYNTNDLNNVKAALAKLNEIRQKIDAAEYAIEQITEYVGIGALVAAEAGWYVDGQLVEGQGVYGETEEGLVAANVIPGRWYVWNEDYETWDIADEDTEGAVEFKEAVWSDVAYLDGVTITDSLLGSKATLDEAQDALDRIYGTVNYVEEDRTASRPFATATAGKSIAYTDTFEEHYAYFLEALERYTEFVKEATDLNDKIKALYDNEYTAEGRRVSIVETVDEYDNKYLNLDAEQKVLVSHYGLIAEMYEGIQKEFELIATVENQITTIGTVHFTNESKTLIDYARAGETYQIMTKHEGYYVDDQYVGAEGFYRNTDGGWDAVGVDAAGWYLWDSSNDSWVEAEEEDDGAVEVKEAVWAEAEYEDHLIGGYDNLRADSKEAIEAAEDHNKTFETQNITINYGDLEAAEAKYEEYKTMFDDTLKAIDVVYENGDNNFKNNFAEALKKYTALTTSSEKTNFIEALQNTEIDATFNKVKVDNYNDLYLEMRNKNSEHLRASKESVQLINKLADDVDSVKVYLTVEYTEKLDAAKNAFQMAKTGGYSDYVGNANVLEKAIELYEEAVKLADAWIKKVNEIIVVTTEELQDIETGEWEEVTFKNLKESLSADTVGKFLAAYADAEALLKYVPDAGESLLAILAGMDVEYEDGGYSFGYPEVFGALIDKYSEGYNFVVEYAVYANYNLRKIQTAVDAVLAYEKAENAQGQAIAKVIDLLDETGYEDGVDADAAELMGKDFKIKYAEYEAAKTAYAEYINKLNGYILTVAKLINHDEKGELGEITEDMLKAALDEVVFKPLVEAVNAINEVLQSNNFKLTFIDYGATEVEAEEGNADIPDEDENEDSEFVLDFSELFSGAEGEVTIDKNHYLELVKATIYGDTVDTKSFGLYYNGETGGMLKAISEYLVNALEVEPIGTVTADNMYVVDVKAAKKVKDDIEGLGNDTTYFANVIEALNTVIANSDATVAFVNAQMANSEGAPIETLEPIENLYNALHSSQQDDLRRLDDSNANDFFTNLRIAQFQANAAELQGKVAELEAAVKGDNEEYDEESIYAQLAAIKEELAALEEKGYDDTELKGRVEALETAVAELKAADEEIKGDITALEDRVAALEETVAGLENYDDTKVKADIEAIKTDVDALKEFVDNYEEYDDAEVKASIAALEGRMTAVETDIAALKAADQAHDEKIDALDAAVKALQEFVDGYEEYDDTELKAAVKALQDWVDGYKAYDDAEVKAAVKALQDWVDAYKAYDDAEVKASIEALEDAVSKLHNYDDSELAAKVAELEAALKKANDDRAAADKAHDDAISGVQGYCTGLLIALIVTFLVAACGVVLVFLFKKKA